MSMTGDDLRKFRERRGLERGELAELLNNALGTKYDGESVARWERGSRRPSKPVTAFVEELSVSTGLSGGIIPPAGPTAGDELEPDELEREHVGDTAPGPGPTPEPQMALLSGGSAYTKACTELWEMIGTGVGMIGASIGNQPLVTDGAIILGDAAALGAAWGRLAETNDTFRRMLAGVTEGGVWLQVALATGTTFSRCYQAHAQHAEAVAAHQAAQNQAAHAHDDRHAEPAAA